MICSAPFVLIVLFVQAALALPQAGKANDSTPPMSTTPYSSTGTPPNTSSYPSTTPYSTTGSTPAYTSSSSSYTSSSSCTCPPSTPPAYQPMMGKNGTSYSSGPSSVYPSSSCSCYSSTPYSSQPTYTSSSSYSSSSSYPSSSFSYPPTETTHPPKESKPYPPPSKSSPQPPTTSPSATLRTTFDTTFDNKSGLMNNVACSNGANGLAARFPTFGDVPSFPFIGGAFDVVWNSPNCGSCWNLTNAATGTSINIVAVDTAGSGFNIAQEAFVKLNGGQIGQGFLDVLATKVSPSACGL